MPAHTKAADVGVAKLSDGTVLTARDRAANDAADHVAKRGAETHRVPKDIRKTVKLRERLAEWAARTLAVATFAANNAPNGDGEPTLRDSAGLSRAARKKAAAAATRAAEAGLDAFPLAVSPATSSEAGLQRAGVTPTPGPKAARHVAEDSSSSEDEVLVLERMARMPSAAQRCSAHAARAEAEQRTATLRVVQSVARRAVPPRVVPGCPAKKQVVKTLVATASASRAASPPPTRPCPSTSTEATAAEVPGPRQSRGFVRASARPTKARQASLAQERQGSAAAIACLLSCPRG